MPLAIHNWIEDPNPYDAYYVAMNDTFLVGTGNLRRGSETPNNDDDTVSRIAVVCFDEDLEWAGAHRTKFWST